MPGSLAGANHFVMSTSEGQPASPAQGRHWYQFRLQTLLLVIVLASLGLSWLAVKLEEARRHREWISPRPLAKTATLELYAVSPGNAPGTRQAVDPNTKGPLYLATPAIVSTADIATVERSEIKTQQPSITVNLTRAGAARLAQATAKPAEMRVAILANGAVVAVPKVHSPLAGKFCIAGGEIQKHREELFQSLTKK